MDKPPLRIGPSKIHGDGLFATAKIPANTNLGLAMRRVATTGKPDRDWDQTIMSRKLNHSADPSVKLSGHGNELYFVTTRDVEDGEELTADYREATMKVATNFLRRSR